MARIFTTIDAAEEAYVNLKNKIIQRKVNTSEAISLLNQIINDLPNTWIAKLAKELLKEL